MTRLFLLTLFLGCASVAQAASLGEMATTMSATGQMAGSTAAAATPTAPPAVAPPPPENGLAAVETPLEKKRIFDNSRTNIEIFNRTASDKNRIKSILYTPDEIKDIHMALNTYLKYAGRGGELTFDEEAFLSRLGGLKKSAGNRGQNRFFTYPQFFLDSLVYYSSSEWLVWINGEKITQDTSKEGSNIHVVQISPDKVTVEWFPLEINRVLDTWRRFPNPDVLVDPAHGQVVFTLKPNQTFSSYSMSVLEGRVLPVTVDITQETSLSLDEKIEGMEGEGQKTENVDNAPGTEEKSQEGLGGLIKSYQNLKKEE